ncbi:MAG: NUDIX domain-containing protein [Nanoarchaeota archaeon]
MEDFKIVTERTIGFLVKDDKIWLSRKKEGQGAGNLNGFGGKLEPRETPEDAAVREIFEESDGIIVEKKDLIKRAQIDFHFPFKGEWNQRTHVYFVKKWSGDFGETKEMAKAEPLDIKNIPYSKMWDSDKYWLPIILGGRRIRAYFRWKEDNKTVDRYSIEFLD